MLRNKNGLLVNACAVSAGQDFSRLVQSDRVDVPIRVPESGMPLTKEAVICRPIYKNKPVTLHGTAVKHSTTLKFDAQYFDEGLLIERLDDRLHYLEYLVANSTGRGRRDAEAKLTNMKRNTSGMPRDAVIRVYAVDADGKMYASSNGTFQSAKVDVKHVRFSDGETFYDKIDNYASHSSNKNGVLQVFRSLCVREVPSLSTNVSLTEESIKDTLGLLGLLLTTRGLGRVFSKTDDVMAEFKLVAEPLLDALGDSGLVAWEMPWALSSFKRLGLSTDKRMIANFVGGYLTASIELLSVNASGTDVFTYSQIPLGTALSQGQWAFNNNTHSVKLGTATFSIDPVYNDVITKALTLSSSDISAIVSVILDAAMVYGKSMHDGDVWATALWCDWIGISGCIGAPAINASR